MEQDIFEKCKILALECGQNMEYRDPYGCGLHISYGEMFVGAVPRKSVRVYFGKREVYFHDKYTGEVYYCNDSANWEKLVKYLFDRYQRNVKSKRYNRTLVKACKKEVELNELIFGKYTLGCGGLVKDQGVFCKTPYGTSRHTYEVLFDGHDIKIALNRDSGYHLFVWYDGVNVYSYTWGESKVPRGRYIPGEWEDDLYDIVEELLSA